MSIRNSQAIVQDGITFRKGPLIKADVRVVHTDGLGRALKGAVVGNIIEWYEFGVFGFLITVMGPVFLPAAEPAVQSLYLFGTFAVTFLARPVGGIFFGWLGDRIGRRKVLTFTLLFMSLATLTTGLLPGYESIGIWAPILLVLIRLLQGFSASGEYTSAATFLSEYAPDRRRGFFVGIMAATTYVGFALGAGLVGLLQLTTNAGFMQEWGWRIPFLIVLPMTSIAFYFRYRVKESPAFAAVLKDRQVAQQQSDETSKNMGVIKVIKSQGRAILPVIGIAAAGNVIAYTMLSFAPTYLNQTLGFKGAEGNLVLFPLYILAAVFTVIAGAMSDRIGRKRTLTIGAVVGIVVAVPAFLMMASGSLILAALGALALMVASAVFSQSYASTLPEQFPTEARSSALGLAYNLGNAAFGGTAPLIVGALIASTGNVQIPAYYLIGASLLGLLSILGLKETGSRPLNGSLPNAETEREAEELVSTQSQNPLLNLDVMPLPYDAFGVGADGNEVMLQSTDANVQRAAAAAGIRLRAQHLASVDET
jgi:MHS family proline/betaine transporter-like MFS transporter